MFQLSLRQACYNSNDTKYDWDEDEWSDLRIRDMKRTDVTKVKCATQYALSAGT